MTLNDWYGHFNRLDWSPFVKHCLISVVCMFSNEHDRCGVVWYVTTKSDFAIALGLIQFQHLSRAKLKQEHFNHWNIRRVCVCVFALHLSRGGTVELCCYFNVSWRSVCVLWHIHFEGDESKYSCILHAGCLRRGRCGDYFRYFTIIDCVNDLETLTRRSTDYFLHYCHNICLK